MITQGTVLEINRRKATVVAVELYISERHGKMEARVEYTWDDTGTRDGSVGSILMQAIKDGDVILVQ